MTCEAWRLGHMNIISFRVGDKINRFSVIVRVKYVSWYIEKTDEYFVTYAFMNDAGTNLTFFWYWHNNMNEQFFRGHGRWDNKGLTFRYMAQREIATCIALLSIIQH